MRTDSDKIYAGLGAMAKAGTVKTVRQVIGELKKHVEAHKIIKPHEKNLVLATDAQYCVAVRGKLGVVKREAGYLWQQIGSKNPDPADPWLVAVAAAHGYTIVTNENQNSPVKIPAACKVPGLACRCISGPHFLIEVGLVLEIEPEHISPHAFFNLGGPGSHSAP